MTTLNVLDLLPHASFRTTTAVAQRANVLHQIDASRAGL